MNKKWNIQQMKNKTIEKYSDTQTCKKNHWDWLWNRNKNPMLFSSMNKIQYNVHNFPCTHLALQNCKESTNPT